METCLWESKRKPDKKDTREIEDKLFMLNASVAGNVTVMKKEMVWFE